MGGAAPDPEEDGNLPPIGAIPPLDRADAGRPVMGRGDPIRIQIEQIKDNVINRLKNIGQFNGLAEKEVRDLVDNTYTDMDNQGHVRFVNGMVRFVDNNFRVENGGGDLTNALVTKITG